MTYPRAIIMGATLIAVGIVLAGTSASSGGRYDQCETTVVDRLAELDIAEADVAGITYVPEHGGASRASRGVVIGSNVWVSLESCDGAVVIRMTHHCRIKQTSTRGQCRVPGLKNY